MRKKSLISLLAVAFVFVLGMPDLYAQQQGANPPAQDWYCPCRQMQGANSPAQGWYCPWRQMGGGMRGGRGFGRCLMGQGAAYNPQGHPLTMDRAKQMLENYVSYKYNPNLKVGDVLDKGDIFEAAILTKDGSLVEKIQVDKNTGWFRNAS